MPFKSRARKGKGVQIQVDSDSSVSQPPPEKEEIKKFVSPRAQQRFEQCMKERALYMERGFVYRRGRPRGYPSFIHSVINAHKWHAFCQSPPAAPVQLVREFYANYDDADPDTVFVRGRVVPFTSAAINSIYDLPDVEDDFKDFADGLSEDQLDEIIEELCVEGTEWTRATRGSMTFPRESLQPGPKIWYHFLRFRLMPSSHYRSVHKERAILLHCMMTGRPLNVGRMIRQQVGVCAGRNSGGLWFPSLIAQLCIAYGVVVEESETKEQPAAAISTNALARLLQNDVQEEADGAPAPAPNAPDQGAPAAAQFNPDVIASLSRMEQRLSQMEVLQYDSVQQMREFWKYTKQRDLALQKHYRANSKRFHSFPDFPQSLCSSSSGDEEPSPVEEAAPLSPASSSSNHQHPEEAAVPQHQDKGKAAAPEASNRRMTLRSGANWRWKG